MLAAQRGATTFWNARLGPAAITVAGRTTLRALSGKPPEPAEVDDSEEIKQAMEVMVKSKQTVGEHHLTSLRYYMTRRMLCKKI